MKIGYIQFKPIFGEKEKNLEKIEKFIKKGVEKEADLLVLPELSTTGYAFKNKNEAKKLADEEPNGTSFKKFTMISKKYNVALVVGFCEKNKDKLFNSALIVNTNGEYSIYRKIHLFYKEKKIFNPGNREFEVYKIFNSKIGVIICFDWIFPESIRVLTLKGAEIICHPSNLVLPYCQTAMLGAAIQNKVYIITANRIGKEREYKFTGRSQIVDPMMKILASSKENIEEVKVVKIDIKKARNKKLNKYNDLIKDRKPIFYKRIIKP